MKRLLFTFALAAGLVANTAALTNKVLIIGIDGTMPSALAVARSPNLEAWIEAAPPTRGAGQTLVLLDTNAPPDQAFYRVSCRLP